VSVTALVVMLAGCSGGGGGGGASAAPTTPLSGKVSAPGGALAFNAPTGLQRFFAELFGRSAVAALPGTQPVAGATVKIIEINSAGNQVGPDIAAAVTGADGSFTLNVPATFIPSPRFVVRATGTTGALDRLVTDFSIQDVDPATHVAKTLVLQQLQAGGGNIQTLQPLQVLALSDEVAVQVNNVAPSGTSSALVTSLTAAAQTSEELTNGLGNLSAASSIAGTVTDAGGAPLAGIKIVVRDFNQWVTRAESFTNASGQYSLNIAAGDYILGALNFTAASMAASEWWTCNDVSGGPSCGAANQFSAAKVTVGTGTLQRNFKLEPGARIEGTVSSAATAAALAGVKIGFRDFASDQPVAFRDTQADGGFRINVRPGVYYMSARNSTLSPHATGVYNGPSTGGTASGGGGATAADATPMTLVAGTTTDISFPLTEGGVVQGAVTDGFIAPPGNGVAGISVRFDDATDASVEALRTDVFGNYRMWVRPGSYIVRARGQTADPVMVVAFSSNNNPAPLNFGAAVARADATVFAPGGMPLAQVKVRVYEAAGSQNFVGHENTNGDGTVEVYAPASGSYLVEYKVDNGSTTVGTAIHDGSQTPSGTTTLAAGAQVPLLAGATFHLNNITLPAGGELKGIVTVAGVPARNKVVQVRSGAGGGSRITNTRTMSDGSYTTSVVPLASGPNRLPRVCAFIPNGTNCPGAPSNPVGTPPSSAGTFAAVDNVPFDAGKSNTADISIP
jgi:5-hydroxyisourate hydrolase-like protein (transthyretin family)